MRIARAFLLPTLACTLSAQAITELPYSPSLDLTSMDPSVQACQDFYKFSCGNWNKKNPIPADQASWDVYSKLTFDNERLLWGLLEESAKPGPNRTAAQQKIGDYYHACMDLPAIEKAGIAPIQPRLDAIARIQTLADLSRYVTSQNVLGTGYGALFGFGSNQDFENSQNVIAFAERGRLGLPDRDYYTKTDPKSVEIRARYVEHLTRTFGMIGDTPADAAAHAKQVMSIESALAKAELTRVELRDPHKLLHKVTRRDLEALDPSYDWNGFFAAMPIPASAQIVNITEPAYYQELEHQFKTRSIDEWKSLLRWDLVRGSAEALSTPFVQASFDFYGKYLRGTPELQPRWRRCVTRVNRDLGEELGKVFVAKTFSADTKARTLAMTQQIEAAMEEDLKQLPWMSDATREQALRKLHTIVNKIGYPDQLARLQRADGEARRFLRQCRARRQVRNRPRAGQDRQAASIAANGA